MSPADTPRNPVSNVILHTRPIPSTGEEIPIIGLGTWRVFDVGRKADERKPLEQCVAYLAAEGRCVIDSSPMYGRAEDVVGEVVETLAVRERLFIATKVWTTGEERGVEQMRASLRKLRVDHVDLMQVHNLVDTGTHLETLRRWKGEGLTRYVGVTHYAARSHADVVRVLQREPVDFVQINYSVDEREAERTVLPIAADRGIAVIVNRPFASGGTLTRLRRTPLPPFAEALECTSWAQLLLKFVVSHTAVTCTIPATADPAHLRDNVAAGSGPLPDAATRHEIARAARS